MKRYTILILLFMTTLATFAAKYYKCDFETEETRNNWLLNPCASQSIDNAIKNKWYMGELGNNTPGGHNGLYISCNQGVSETYQNDACCVLVYDTLTLDHLTSGDYHITFDYRSMGGVDAPNDGLYMLWIPVVDNNGDTIHPMSSPNATISATYQDYVIQLRPDFFKDNLRDALYWQQFDGTISNKRCDGKPHYLVFAWINGSNQPQQPGACLDNIEIMDNRPCAKPRMLQTLLQGPAVNMSWIGEAPEYEVTAFSYETNEWFGPVFTTDTFYNFVGIPAGQTLLSVRAHCDVDLYSAKLSETRLVYYPDEMCVDYLDLEKTACYVNNSQPQNTLNYNDFIRQLVDEGYNEGASRHTIHYDKNELDRRTGYHLHTVPDGEIASVRLGNWFAGNNAERIEYTFPVDTLEHSVLLLKYAVIIEAPGHEDYENPRFKMDILMNGESVGRCGSADFNCNDVWNRTTNVLKPGSTEMGWHLVEVEASGTSAPILWKDWTTVGVNLRDPQYQGKNITVQLTTHDCTFSMHCGYAYFTLSCSDGKLKDMKCGEINPTFIAPDGFNYRWMYASSEKYRDPNTGSIPEQYILSREQVYEAGYHTDSVFTVDCVYTQDSTCYFSLYASTLATNPVAVIQKPLVTPVCKDNIYKVTFDAKSCWLEEFDHLTNTTRVGRGNIDYVEWDFGDGRKYYDKKVTREWPVKDSTYHVQLVAHYGTCSDTATYDLKLTDLQPSQFVDVHYLCDEDKNGTGFVWQENQKSYYDYGFDTITFVSPITTCDSVIILDLREPYRDTLHVLLMDNETYEWHGQTYNQTGLYTYPSVNCDTAYVLDLEVYTRLVVTGDSDLVVCRGDQSFDFYYNVVQGKAKNYELTLQDVPSPLNVHPFSLNVNGDLDASSFITVDIPDDLYPNVYQGVTTFIDTISGNVTIPFKLSVLYPADIIKQRWNDVLIITNSQYNGGFEFSAYQWYENNQPIELATRSYLATLLNQSSLYSALLTRSTDSISLMTCEMQPVMVSETSYPDIPTLVSKSSILKLPHQIIGTAYWYNLLGVLIDSQVINADNSIITPTIAGTYVLTIVTDNDESVRQKIVVQ